MCCPILFDLCGVGFCGVVSVGAESENAPENASENATENASENAPDIASENAPENTQNHSPKLKIYLRI